MKRKCCVPSCNSADKCTVCQVSLSYFKPPKDLSLLKKWETVLGLKNHVLSSRDRVCSLHFKRSDILTKRFISMKRPSTNSKMVFEVSKLERNTIPASFLLDVKRCCHKETGKHSSCSTNGRSRSPEHLETSPGACSVPCSSQSEYSDETTEEDYEEQPPLRPTRRDYRLLAQSVENRSTRRQIRVFQELRAKWVAQSKRLETQTRLLEKKIRELQQVDCDSEIE